MTGYRAKLTLAAASALLVPLAVASATLAPTQQQHAAAVSAKVSKVLIIEEENHSHNAVIGSSAAPYITSLAKTYGTATSYKNITHPSLPNYLAETFGDTFGVNNDKNPPANVQRGPSIFDQGPWRVYAESMSQPCQKTDSGFYDAHHNPAVYEANLASCKSLDLPFTQFKPGATHAPYTFIVPNVVNDMHDGNDPERIKRGDAWLKDHLPAILAGPDYRAGNLVVFIVWDEGSQNLPFVAISPYTKRVRVTQAVNHYSLLRTGEEILGYPLLRKAQSAPSMLAALHLT